MNSDNGFVRNLYAKDIKNLTALSELLNCARDLYIIIKYPMVKYGWEEAYISHNMCGVYGIQLKNAFERGVVFVIIA